MSYRLIAGLGNPGTEYDGTRHNVGFQVLDRLAAKNKEVFSRNKSLKGEIAQIQNEEGERVLLVKPQTYMNSSGDCLQKMCSYYKIDPKLVLVVYDEINFDHGKVKATIEGGPGGHNGIAHILTKFKAVFTRLRIGIGPKNPAEMDLADFVLGKFTSDQQEIIDASLDLYVDCVERLLDQGPQKAMNHINRRNKTTDNERKQTEL